MIRLNTKINFSFIIPLIIMLCCGSNQRDKDSKINENKDFIKGSWIYNNCDRLQILDINDTNDIRIYLFEVYSSNLTLDNKDIKTRSWFVNSKAILYFEKNKESNDTIVVIETNNEHYKFYYVLKQDTLIQWNEEGLGDRLIKMKNK